MGNSRRSLPCPLDDEAKRLEALLRAYVGDTEESVSGRPPVYTIRYGGRPPAEFKALLTRHGVRVVVDVRIEPDQASMGAYKLAKTPERGIQATLADVGIKYVSLRELGNPFRRDKKWPAKFAALLDTNKKQWLALLAEIPTPFCLLCAEKRVAECHRKAIADLLATAGPTVEHIEQMAQEGSQAAMGRPTICGSWAGSRSRTSPIGAHRREESGSDPWRVPHPAEMGTRPNLGVGQNGSKPHRSRAAPSPGIALCGRVTQVAVQRDHGLVVPARRAIGAPRRSRANLTWSYTLTPSGSTVSREIIRAYGTGPQRYTIRLRNVNR